MICSTGVRGAFSTLVTGASRPSLISASSSADTLGCSLGVEVDKRYQAIAQSRPITAITTKATRQPSHRAKKPTIGPAKAPPSGPPAWLMPMARARSLIGNQLLTALLAVVDTGPSPTPNRARTISSDQKLKASAVEPHSNDQKLMDQVSTRLGPKRSAR
ncbi:hypothetical protein D3C72_1103390 [compost metagenome]